MNKNEPQEFCWNSRRWVLLMIAGRGIPSTCPYNIANSGCKGESCAYHENRLPSRYFIERWGFLESFGEDDG